MSGEVKQERRKPLAESSSIKVVHGRVAGASHKLKNAECQDNFKVETFGGLVVLAAADGHGSESCKYSKTGSEIAVNVFCKVIRDACSGDCGQNCNESLKSYLTREGGGEIARMIHREWNRRVEKSHRDPRKKREVPLTESGKVDKERIRKLHGTTLLGLVLTPTFYFAFGIGDGDVLLIDAHGTRDILPRAKILGVQTHSLSHINACEKAVAVVGDVPDCSRGGAAFMVATDGFSNSYPSESAFHEACSDYYAAIKEHGAEAVQTNLNDWLEETSERGSGDDITVLFAIC
jgi:hypothetical protein